MITQKKRRDWSKKGKKKRVPPLQNAHTAWTGGRKVKKQSDLRRKAHGEKMTTFERPGPLGKKEKREKSEAVTTRENRLEGRRKKREREKREQIKKHAQSTKSATSKVTSTWRWWGRTRQNLNVKTRRSKRRKKQKHSLGGDSRGRCSK